MVERMDFPKTVEKYMEQYKIVDTEKVYSNGIAFVPIFRMNQWFEHLNSVEYKSTQMLDVFMKLWCRIDDRQELCFRCNICPFCAEDEMCSLKVFKDRFCPSYGDFGSMV